MFDNGGESSQQHINFSHNEQNEIESLKNTMQNRGSSKIEKEIAEAKLNLILQSKQKPPHNHHHRSAPMETDAPGSASNIFRDDLTFEKYEMGSGVKKEKGSKVRNMSNDEVSSVKFNHKARGVTKEKIENEMAKEQMEDLHL